MGINKLWTWVCTYKLVQSCWLFQPCNCSQDIRTEAAEPLTSAAYIRAWTRPVTGACKYQQSLEQGSVIQLVLIVITTHKKLVYSTTGRHNVNHKQICIDSFGLGTWSSSPSTYANTKNLNTVLCNKKQRLKAPVVVNKAICVQTDGHKSSMDVGTWSVLPLAVSVDHLHVLANEIRDIRTL